MPLVRRRVGFGDRHDDQELGARAFDENHFSPLITHSSPSCYGAAVERPSGRTPPCGSVIEKHDDDVAVEQRLEVLLLLLGRAVVREDLGVAGVGRLAAEHDRRPASTRPRISFISAELHLAVALAAELGAEVAGPQALRLHLFLERPDERVAALVLHVIRMDAEVPSGSTFSSTKPCIQSSFAWNSGSVSKSHAIHRSPAGRCVAAQPMSIPLSGMAASVWRNTHLTFVGPDLIRAGAVFG